jgi:hypothetical protein
MFPSDVVALIEHQFSWVVAGTSPSGVNYQNGAAVAGLANIVEQIPDSLLTLSAEQRRDFLFAIATLRHLVSRLESGISSAGSGWALTVSRPHKCRHTSLDAAEGLPRRRHSRINRCPELHR